MAYDYSKSYRKYKEGDVSDTDFEKYVDEKHGSYWKLIDAYNKGEDVDTKFSGQYQHPAGLSPSQQAEYWQKRGATSKAAFGRAHAAEDDALRSGTYHGGKSGRTDYMPGTDAWETLFPGDDPTTTFEDWIVDPAGGATGATDGGWATARGGGAPGSANYPMGIIDYKAPSAMSGIPLDFQPWMQPDHIPDSLWNYQAPTLNEWEVERDWDWATKPASEYGPKPPAVDATTGNGYGPEGGPGDAPPGGWGSGEGFGLIDDITNAYNNAKIASMTAGWMDDPTQYSGDWANPNVNVNDSGWTVG